MPARRNEMEMGIEELGIVISLQPLSGWILLFL